MQVDECTASSGDADMSALGQLLSAPGRCRILQALADGRALPASMLATEAGVSTATASEHLRVLLDGGLLSVLSRGRFRYYRLAGPAVAELVEVLCRIAPPRPITSLREGTRAYALRMARSCYDHIAGQLAVRVLDGWLERGVLAADETMPDPPVPTVDGPDLSITPNGRQHLRDLGLPDRPGDAVRTCVDWSERRPHLRGRLGADLLHLFTEHDWVRAARHPRALSVTAEGRTALRERFGITWPP